jgi:hypothetical protein
MREKIPEKKIGLTAFRVPKDHLEPGIKAQAKRAVAQIHFLELPLTTPGWSGYDNGMTIQKLAAPGK